MTKCDDKLVYNSTHTRLCSRTLLRCRWRWRLIPLCALDSLNEVFGRKFVDFDWKIIISRMSAERMRHRTRVENHFVSKWITCADCRNELQQLSFFSVSVSVAEMMKMEPVTRNCATFYASVITAHLSNM